MKKKSIGFILILSSCLSGCSAEQENEWKDVSVEAESLVYEKVSEMETEEFSKEQLLAYVEDEYFFDGDELEFYTAGNEKYHIKIKDVYASQDIYEFGEYFQARADELQDEKARLDADGQCRAENLTYVSVTAEITNMEAVETKLCIQHIGLQFRITDDSKLNYGVGNKRLAGMEKNEYVDSELLHDYEERGDCSDYYMISMLPGQTISLTMLFNCDKTLLDEEMYLGLGGGGAVSYDSIKDEWRHQEPRTRYLRIEIDE